MATIYDNGAEYDALGMGAGVGEEVAFYRSLTPAGGAMLELACGTGRLTVPLAEAGAETVGIDNAPGMLAAARAKAVGRGASAAFVEGDIREFSLGRRFETILIPNNSLGHLHALGEIEACFACVRRHLAAANGRFVVEVFNPSLALLMRNPGVEYPIAEFDAPDGGYGGGRVVVTERVAYDAATQISHAEWLYKGDGGTPLSTRTLDLRMFFPQELDALLTLSGFAIEAKYGNYGRAPFASSSIRQIVVCRSVGELPTD